ncbi:MAG: DUF1571 domain-containing protein [Gemmataceae bacterium]|nr:DUF1571 domain-containing protein [Gemmataceae bacterium]
MRRWFPILLILVVAAGIYWGTRNREEAKPTRHTIEVVAQPASLTKPVDPIRDDPLGYLETCLSRCEKETQGYIVTFRKREWVDGRLLKPEKIIVHFRAKPFSVHMNWKEGEGRAGKVLYVEGENKGNMLVRPKTLSLFVFEKDPEGPESKASGRYPVTKFGILNGMRSTIESMRAAKERGTLHLRYEGLVKLEVFGDRPVHQFKRTPYDPPEVDGINRLTLFIDPETGLQVGSIVENAAEELLGEYFFTDLQLNPMFSPEQFTRKTI